MTAVFRREFKSYFINMIGYIFLGALFLSCGILTTAECLISASAMFENVLGFESILLVLFIPILTMRSMSDDRRARTDQLLYSMPLNMTSIVLGKYFAMTAVFGIGCLGIAVIPLLLSSFGTVSFGTVYATLFGFFLLGCALIAICMFLSSLTESQVIAAVLGIGISAALYAMSLLVSIIPTDAMVSFIAFLVVAALLALIVYLLSKSPLLALGTAALGVIPTCVFYIIDAEKFEGLFPKVVDYLAIFDRFYNFVYGVFDLTAVVYFISAVVFFVFLSVQSFDHRRWA
ncbi:MAG: ABC-2 transporter permease [Clostridia bacterium]|nr:ABC-2 transporter permease [Clostridia bacterium]